ncbi:energy transducer TonB [Paraburkholderia sp. CNPSo 3274]|uniref:energy transducer TonB n=1 Tax=Paraburkholderia sp. CNPSo 3274 TaxID=2940932 RepID=UPI0020B6E306|nr:energy transducer TonB [Paraburkholderia sp. CNPSo 3274]MCP3707293.1 energy transducer TonB [Paraburkholderia sp. CNPSo 3274]
MTTAHASAENASATPAPAGSTSAASGDTTAHPLSQPLPVLPDDLREYAYQAIALARFTIHPDGSVDVALVKPTQNPRLNQLLLETLRNWHFFPAMKQGHPVASEQDIRVHFNIE